MNFLRKAFSYFNIFRRLQKLEEEQEDFSARVEEEFREVIADLQGSTEEIRKIRTVLYYKLMEEEE